MAALKVLTLVLLAVTACSASALPGRIVGGAPTTIDKYPSLVQVDFLGIFTGTWSQSCAANILNTRYTLSAAHCFAGFLYSAPYRRIRAGATYRNTGGLITYVEKEINHPSYGLNGYDGDISVVLLLTPLTYSPVIQRATIVNQGAIIPDNMPVVHAGWGAVAEGGAASPELLDVTVFTVNHDLCRERYLGSLIPGLVTENMICAGILDVGGRGTCDGDSGGPLYYGNNIIGITSWSFGCAEAIYPGVNTRVAAYTNWIVATAV